VCTTVTTTRKLVSVLSSIAVYGHSMSAQRWLGVALAAAGVLGELETKFRPKPHAKLKM
jgi:UDP-galactose transporter B1